MKYSKTGKHPGIPVRNADFGFADIPKYWFNRDPLFTHYFTGLSTLFPEGEAFFVRSVRKLRARVKGNEELDSRIGAFIGQEAMHSREHEAFHVSAQKHGLDPKSLEAWTGKILGFMERNFSEKSQLLITTALEHYTAVLVVEMMKDIHEMMDDKNVRDLWKGMDVVLFQSFYVWIKSVYYHRGFLGLCFCSHEKGWAAFKYEFISTFLAICFEKLCAFCAKIFSLSSSWVSSG